MAAGQRDVDAARAALAPARGLEIKGLLKGTKSSEAGYRWPGGFAIRPPSAADAVASRHNVGRRLGAQDDGPLRLRLVGNRTTLCADVCGRRARTTGRPDENLSCCSVSAIKAIGADRLLGMDYGFLKTRDGRAEGHETRRTAEVRVVENFQQPLTNTPRPHAATPNLHEKLSAQFSVREEAVSKMRCAK
jgi:hypothetical protein